MEAAMKVEIDGDKLIIHVDTMEELDAVVRRYGQSSLPRVAASANGNGASPPSPPRAAEEPRKYPPAQPGHLVVRSSSKREAMLKLFRSLSHENHRRALVFLAGRGEEGANKEEMLKTLGVPGGHKISGFTSAISRREISFGLEPTAVMRAESPGIVAGERIYKYTLSPEMVKLIEEEGLGS
jgi:hypothetical protein